MVKYNYDKRIASKIIEIAGRSIDGINAYKLSEEVRKSFLDRPPNSPNDSQILATRKPLQDWLLLEKREKLFFLGEIWNTISRFGYEPHDIIKFLKISQAICVASLIGTRYVRERKGPIQRGDFPVGIGLIADNVNQVDFEKTTNSFDFKKEGISKKEIMEKRFRNPTNYHDLEFTSQEIDDYLKLLTSIELIKPMIDNIGNIRFVIHPKVEQFYVDWWIAFFNEILFRFQIMSNFPKSLVDEEKKWYVTHHGQQNYDNVFKDNKHYQSYEKKYKKRKGLTDKEMYQIRKKQREYRDRRLEEGKGNIMFLYGFLTKKYKDTVIGIPGLKELIIDFICPKDLLKIIEKSKNEN